MSRVFLLLFFPTLAYAQDLEKVKEAVPADIFNWIMAGVVLIIGGLCTVIVILYRSKGTGLTPEQAAILKKIHDDLLPLAAKLETEQEGRREDIERLMGEQKDVFIKGLELTGKMPPLLIDLKGLLERVERLLRAQEN